LSKAIREMFEVLPRMSDVAQFHDRGS